MLIITIIAILIVIILLTLMIILFCYIKTEKLKYATMLQEKDVYRCSLLLKIRFNQADNMTFTNFSYYDKHKLIIIIKDFNEDIPEKLKDEIDNKFFFSDDAIVYKKGAEYGWVI